MFPRPRRWILVRRTLAAAVLLIAVVVLRRPLFQGNFGVVEPGRVFRSAQPGRGFGALIRSEHLGAVLNLRGGTRADPFYRDEVAEAERAGVEFYDLPISATMRPSRRELMAILGVLDRCRYPLLIHCKWGSDRTGLASALYRMDKLGQSPEVAAQAFSVIHGHVPLLGPQALHEPLDEYAEWLRATGQAHTPPRFRSWLETEYRSPRGQGRWPVVRPGPRSPNAVAATPRSRR